MHGFVFIILGLCVIFWQIVDGKNDGIKENLLRKHPQNPALTVFFFIISLFCLFLGGKFLVDGGVAIANFIHIPQAIIGITAIAVGTSFPELAVSIAAFTKKVTESEEKLVIGNILGSNIFNILFGAGMLGLFGVKNFKSMISLYAFFIFTLILGFLIYFFRGKTIPPYIGVGLILSYIIYFILLLFSL